MPAKSFLNQSQNECLQKERSSRRLSKGCEKVFDPSTVTQVVPLFTLPTFVSTPLAANVDSYNRGYPGSFNPV